VILVAGAVRPQAAGCHCCQSPIPTHAVIRGTTWACSALPSKPGTILLQCRSFFPDSSPFSPQWHLWRAPTSCPAGVLYPISYQAGLEAPKEQTVSHAAVCCEACFSCIVPFGYERNNGRAQGLQQHHHQSQAQGSWQEQQHHHHHREHQRQQQSHS
jgi:hypothetical protein